MTKVVELQVGVRVAAGALTPHGRVVGKAIRSICRLGYGKSSILDELFRIWLGGRDAEGDNAVVVGNIRCLTVSPVTADSTIERNCND